MKAVVLCICVNFVLGDVLRYGFEFNEVNDVKGNHWAVIVAGSNGWYNYRHQVMLENLHVLLSLGFNTVQATSFFSHSQKRVTV